MKQCLTLVANQVISQAQWQSAIESMIVIENVTERHDGVWDVYCDETSQLSPALRDTLYQLKIDFALQARERLPKRLLISDMDATMVVGETIDDMAEMLGIYDEVSTITALAMRGDIDFRQALSQRLALMKGIHRSEITKMAEQVIPTPGAKALLDAVKEHGMASFLVSGGFTDFTKAVSQMLGFDEHLANRLSYDENNQLDGRWIGELVTAEVKANTLENLAKTMSIQLSETIAIGDGANDRMMIELAGLGVAFYGKPVLREAANAEIHSGSIDNLRWFF